MPLSYRAAGSITASSTLKRRKTATERESTLNNAGTLPRHYLSVAVLVSGQISRSVTPYTNVDYTTRP